MQKLEPATSITARILKGFIQNLNIPALTLDLIFIFWSVSNLPGLPALKFANFKYDFSGQLLGLILASSLYFCYGHILGLHIAPWLTERPKIHGRRQKFIDSDLAAFFVSPGGLYYLVFQVIGILLFLPIYFDMLPVSGMATALIGVPFGIFLAIEIHRKLHGKGDQNPSVYDNFPEFAAMYSFVFLLIFPAEISYRARSHKVVDVIFWGVIGSVLSYFVYRLFRKSLYWLRDLFRRRLMPSLWTAVSAHTIHFTTLLSFALIESLLYTDMQLRGYSNLKIKLCFCLFGLIPLRIMDLFTPPRNCLNLTVATVAFILFLLGI